MLIGNRVRHWRSHLEVNVLNLIDLKILEVRLVVLIDVLQQVQHGLPDHDLISHELRVVDLSDVKVFDVSVVQPDLVGSHKESEQLVPVDFD